MAVMMQAFLAVSAVIPGAPQARKGDPEHGLATDWILFPALRAAADDGNRDMTLATGARP
ncbi:hypothetical protein GCM10007036_12140 [Alsobacter metallidurans]|uniref:Uncharacterized protein n=1 Tax=Alsobacter metallidurans TaxID=340221 RepID=A0A917I680_9HYPH|nr:hypothetical protein [Alsobacter metallidurans]GGH13503.1 hypothetical protein GCM10007036_12140 [Alsobacter metallidurans]